MSYRGNGAGIRPVGTAMRARSGGVYTFLSFGPLPFTQSFQDPDCQPLARCHRRNQTDQCNAVTCLAGPGPGAGAVASAISSAKVASETSGVSSLVSCSTSARTGLSNDLLSLAQSLCKTKNRHRQSLRGVGHRSVEPLVDRRLGAIIAKDLSLPRTRIWPIRSSSCQACDATRQRPNRRLHRNSA